MTLITVSTVKGAPGGTTVALLLGRSLARATDAGLTPLVVECDLSGGDLAPALRLPGLPGTASLALAGRHGLSLDLLLAHTQGVASLPRLRLLLGVAGPSQGTALSWIWRDLGEVLSDPSVLAVADLGRCGLDDRHDDLWRAAVVSLLVTTDGVASLMHAKAAVEAARESGRSLSVVVAGERTRRLSQIAAATNAEVLGALRYDPLAVASVLQGGRAGLRPRTSARRARSEDLLSDVDAMVATLAERLGTRASTSTAIAADAWIGSSGIRQRGIGRLRSWAALIP